MIATVMLTTLLASLVFALAAHCAERGLRAAGLPTRGPWIIASAAAVAVPIGQLLALLVSSPAPAFGPASVQALPITTMLTVGVVERFNPATVANLELVLLGLWLCASLAIGVRLFLASLTLERLTRTWRHGDVAGTPVWISERYGPAVVGLAEPEIIVPRSIASLPPQEQQLAIAHELEHIAGRDQWLVRGAALAVAAVPWNPFVWNAVRRLRSAIEIDCDSRVLRKTPNVDEYASLVLTVASWPRQSPSGALALGETVLAHLEHRLRLMTTKRASRQLVRAVLLLTGAITLAVYGCDVAVNIERPDRNEVHRLDRVVTTAVTTPTPYFEFQVDKPVTIAPGSAAPRYPDILRQAGIEGEVLAQFVVNADGQADVRTFKALTSSHDLFAQAVQYALPHMKFTPGEVRGRRVRQIVQQPFAFSVAR